ncbi:Uncharacterised protein [Vibrio cholerae]|nr:Uncharacterised protein [Vibrio cholerae]
MIPHHDHTFPLRDQLLDHAYPYRNRRRSRAWRPALDSRNARTADRIPADQGR